MKAKFLLACGVLGLTGCGQMMRNAAPAPFDERETRKPLSAVKIEDRKTEGSGRLAAVYGRGSWVSGAGTPAASTTKVRLIIVWRKGDDGRWRVAQELLHAEPATP